MTDNYVFQREYLGEFFSSVPWDDRLADKYFQALQRFRRRSATLPDAVIFGHVTFRQMEAQHKDIFGINGDDIVVSNEVGGGPNIKVYIDPTVEYSISFAEKSSIFSTRFGGTDIEESVKRFIRESAQSALQNGISKKEVRKIIDEVFVEDLLGD